MFIFGTHAESTGVNFFRDITICIEVKFAKTYYSIGPSSQLWSIIRRIYVIFRYYDRCFTVLVHYLGIYFLGEHSRDIMGI